MPPSTSPPFAAQPSPPASRPTSSDPGAAVAPAARPALRSLTLQGAAAMAIAFAAGRLGLDLGHELTTALAARLLDLVFTLGVLAVGVGRARAKGPLT